jgi:peptidoglycan/LPS O-acetylase OafA/YrhL
MAEERGFADPSGRDKGASAEGRLRLVHLDGLRALAASYVVMFHALPGFSAEHLTGPWRLLRRAFAYGHEAVAVFIVLSGYCLMLPVVRRDPERLTVAFPRFVRRRAFRILPPYFATVALSLALLALVPALRTQTGTIWDDSLPGLEAGAVLSHLLVVHNWLPTYAYQINGPLWSVASEWQIYFFFPLCLLPAWRRWGMPGALLVAALVGYAPLLLAPRAAATANPWYLLSFGLGMAAASIDFAPGGLARWLRDRVPWGKACGALWLGCVAFSNAAASWWFSHKPITDMLVGLATASLLVHLAESARRPRPGALLRAFQAPQLVGLGHFSYSLYLTHLPVLALCYVGLAPLQLAPIPLALALLVVGSIASLLVAYAFFLLVERRFLLER